jgi:hypothetical protein
MEVVVVSAAIIVGVGVLVLMFRPFFSDRYEFWECIKFWLTPNFISLFRGEYWEDVWGEMKLFLWLACGFVPGLLTYFGLAHILLA